MTCTITKNQRLISQTSGSKFLHELMHMVAISQNRGKSKQLSVPPPGLRNLNLCQQLSTQCSTGVEGAESMAHRT